MAQPSDDNKTSFMLPPKTVRRTMAKDVAELTWRMFVPSVGGAVLGLVADRRFGTRPWLTLTGVIFGFAMVILLVWQQIRNTRS